ncbi:hypothetical protein [Dickeya undicola]|uniref:hypothetical protein n=1 Tax=Dickeya undicola TaxID=1577887 RepID=UPI001375338B|nr:hypothetical protein [Dickeya undicola]
MTKMETRLCDKTILREWCCYTAGMVLRFDTFDKKANPADCRQNSRIHHKVIFSYFQG